MIKKVERFMRENKMTVPGDSLIVGVSGGADSVCLLYILRSLRKTLDIELTACHVMHGIRGEEAERDAAFTVDLCERLGVPCRVERRDVPHLAVQMNMTVEEAGRYVRRQIFEAAASVQLGTSSSDTAIGLFMPAFRAGDPDEIMERLLYAAKELSDMYPFER